MLIQQPIRLQPRFVERVWGCRSLEPWFDSSDVRIGEVWLSSLDTLTSTGDTLGQLLDQQQEAIFGSGRCERLPLLVKFLFTSENLSVQVHPDDAVADKDHGCPGKTECWYVLKAQPDSRVAWGFREQIAAEEVRRSALDGTLEDRLLWRNVTAGDSIFTPAGTVHAIGAGLVICEIQQNSDITFRLFDYGRGRQLHLEQGIAVADLGPASAEPNGRVLGPGHDLLVECSKFCLERWTGRRAVEVRPSGFYHLWVQTEGQSRWLDQTLQAGEAWLLPAAIQAGHIALDGTALVTYPSWRPTTALQELASPAARAV